ncbi:hypothetical protein SAMN05660733_07770 [Lentzea albidocapillata]|uniref:Short chain dehydrogenase n=1 Tax=Lentzea albidocapillata TaxID=40571 RepID=A0A1W2FRM6_9PSEU|nr:hypothetical protein SAMN05660733_07770 [Lentzea albidocapillata]
MRRRACGLVSRCPRRDRRTGRRLSDRPRRSLTFPGVGYVAQRAQCGQEMRHLGNAVRRRQGTPQVVQLIKDTGRAERGRHLAEVRCPRLQRVAAPGARGCRQWGLGDLRVPGGIRTSIVRNGLFAAGENRDAVIRGFEKRVARTDPGEAAAIVLRGAKRRRARIFVGTDARLVAVLARLVGGHYQDLVPAVGRLLERKRGRRRSSAWPPPRESSPAERR